MARKISRNPNQILRRKPNQFPVARLAELNWGNCPNKNNNTDHGEDADSDTSDSDTIDVDKLQYLRDRFNKSSCECPPGSEK